MGLSPKHIGVLLPHAAAALVVPGIADHKGVPVGVNLSILKVHVIQRTVWEYKRADWKGLNEAYGKLDYDISSFANIDNATEISVHMVLSEAKRFIPTRILREFKGTHPWLNYECRSVILHKQSCAGTDEYKEACESGTRTLKVACAAYSDKTRQELRSLPKGSKRWWSLSKILLDNAPSNCGIPSLKDPKGNWIHEGRG